MGTLIICLAIIAALVFVLKALRLEAKLQRRCEQARQEGCDLALRLDVSKLDATSEVNNTFMRLQEESLRIAEAFHEGFIAGMQWRTSEATARIDKVLDKIDAQISKLPQKSKS